MEAVYGICAVSILLIGMFLGAGIGITYFKPQHSTCKLCRRLHHTQYHEQIEGWDKE